MAFFMHLAHSFGQDKMFILTLMLYCTSKSCAKFKSPTWQLTDKS